MNQPRLERAIWVIYHPESEHASHHFEARLQDQFEAVLHFVDTTAREPIEPTTDWKRGDTAESRPFAGKPIPSRRTA